MKKYFVVLLLLASGCGQPKYKCEDARATYFDVEGRIVKVEDGIDNGYVLMPAAGDAGSFMLGKYAKVENGKIVEEIKGIPEPIEKNTFKPRREQSKQKSGK